MGLLLFFAFFWAFFWSVEAQAGGGLPPPEEPQEQAPAVLPPKSAQAIFEDARFAFRVRNFPLALQLLSQVDPSALPDPNAPIFLNGMVLLSLGRPDEAVDFFKRMLARNPSLLRVRLELGRAFFEARDDVNARQQFNLVLAADIPQPVRANVQRFLDAIRSRRLWWITSNFEIIDDRNVNQATGDTIIYINGLPFRLSEDSREKSGIGVSSSFGATRIFPRAVGGGRAWRVEAQGERKDYSGDDFDTMLVSLFTAHQWNSADSESVAGALFYRRWYQGARYSDVWGVRFRDGRSLSPQFLLRSSLDGLYLTHRSNEGLDGPSLTLNTGLVWRPDHDRNFTFGFKPSIRRAKSAYQGYESLALTVGHYRELAAGFSLNFSAEVGWSEYRDLHPIFATKRRDFRFDGRVVIGLRELEFRGFHPSLALGWTRQDSNHALNDYERPYFSVTVSRRF